MKKILFVRMDHIGDLLCCTPCIRAVRKKYPDAYIGILCTERNAVAVENNPHINARYIAGKSLASKIRCILQIRRERYDEVIVLSSASRTSCFYAKLLGIKRRIALVEPHRKFKHIFTDVLPKATRDEHIITSFMQPLEALGIYENDYSLDYFLPDDIAAWGRERFPKKENILRLAVFIGNVTKPHTHWGVENYVRLCEYLLAKENIEVYVWGGTEEKKYFHLFNRLTGNARFHLLSDLTFAQGGAFLLQCDALIIGSTGPTHLANALRIPVLSIISNYQVRVWRTLGERDMYVAPVDKKADVPALIPLEDVVRMVEDFIGSRERA